jgi:hypothetical protein
MKLRRPSFLDKLFGSKKPRVEVNPFTQEVEVLKPLDVEKVQLIIPDRTWLEAHIDSIVKGVGFLLLAYNLIMAVMYAFSMNLAFMLLFGLSAYYILGYLKLVGKK